MSRLNVFLLLVLTVLISLASHSQDTDGNYLLRDSKVKLTTFYAEINPSTSFSSLNGQLVNISELSTGFILNNRFYFSYFMTGSPKIRHFWGCLTTWSGRQRYLPWNPTSEEG